jgi:hypothetical protein
MIMQVIFINQEGVRLPLDFDSYSKNHDLVNNHNKVMLEIPLINNEKINLSDYKTIQVVYDDIVDSYEIDNNDKGEIIYQPKHKKYAFIITINR